MLIVKCKTYTNRTSTIYKKAWFLNAQITLPASYNKKIIFGNFDLKLLNTSIQYGLLHTCIIFGVFSLKFLDTATNLRKSIQKETPGTSITWYILLVAY
jgi:hypothetical protein